MDGQQHDSTIQESQRNDDVAAAIERRLQQQREQAEEAAAAAKVETSFDENYERRQEFRRLIDPGIVRPNAKELALESLQTLKMLAENILQHPGEEKYRRFKPTNSKIRRTLVEPKGTLEYAVEMGFRPEVENFQPFYIFDTRRTTDLNIGLAMINETLDRETSKKEREERAKREAKEAELAAKEKLKRQFLDDRKSTAMRQQREREAREALAAQRISSPSRPPASPPVTVTPARTGRRVPRMRGTGRTLSGQTVADADDAGEDIPPPYKDESEDEQDEDE
ncbi:hypothetical protein POSPLADRAFT_1066610 [Postia placenta MAD-698-R-SB12]|uniref:PUB domain-containing protein n=1 Tax=Postia placenta MAD-698-R-SB12 TaxID=670580 RepID=A0A1X6MV26_9APHY|nr:hypothetical protein POSPLADRAFT_1066610 [Postia placenta MAD-698-R-SB12]OSX60225.1 hypothetical protein POSPLADRAFT_1066610 [Postia placenta MAD-698-R-SB12]